MSLQDDLTTLVCLFHHQDKAQAAIQELGKAGIGQSDITIIGGPQASADAFEKSELASLEMPDKDYDHLKQGIRDGGLVVAVKATETQANTVEEIFHRHSASKIDDVQNDRRDTALEAVAPVALAAAPIAQATETVGEAVIPVVEESLVVGKRTVERGGVRVVRRMVETPVQEDVNLHEERVVVERHAVDRPASGAELDAQGRVIEMTGTGEEAVVGKAARVVEELVVGKTATEHTETVQDSVRRTEVEIEPTVGSERTDLDSKRNF